ncbi:MAG: glycoside hydrolase family 3 C-terminal domain-containing protein [bacterium]
MKRADRSKKTEITFEDVVSAGTYEEREGRIGELLSGMTLDEKIGQMSGGAGLPRLLKRYNSATYDSGENKRLGIPPVRFTDGPRGVALNRSTCFPVSMARGATWDAELEERVGSAMGVESRAQGANFNGGVCINLLRHPGWGRAQETFGEDPHHVGAMGAAMTAGLQKHVMACVKHFAANSIENARFRVDVRVDERTLREVYLPHFRKCVEAGAASIMSAYNRLNGKFCGHNDHLIRDILKGDWKFDGFVISDFMFCVRNGRAAANAGLDMEMPLTIHYGGRLKRAVSRGDVPARTIDEAVTRILRQKARFAAIGDPAGYGPECVACREHTGLALEVARRGIVLLKNENGALPLRRDGIRTIAVIGEPADRANLGDRGSSSVYPPYKVTPLEGIRNRAGDSVNVIYDRGGNLSDARRIAAGADAVIIVAGLTFKDEGEFIPPVYHIGGDRTNLNLPRAQEKLINAVAAENDRCIVVLEGGSAITMEAWVESAEAILMAWYPGMEGGNAIAEVLFGDVNPSGKLPLTFPKSADQLVHFDKRARRIDYEYYHGYRHFDRDGLEPLFPFGFGLSYTKYEYGNLRLDSKETGKSGKVEASVDVTNSGDMGGEEVVQLYIGYKGSKVDRPIKELKGFGRVALEPGETKTLALEVKAEDLACYNTESGGWEVEKIEYVVHVGPSSRREDLSLRDTFKICGP